MPLSVGVFVSVPFYCQFSDIAELCYAGSVTSFSHKAISLRDLNFPLVVHKEKSVEQIYELL